MILAVPLFFSHTAPSEIYSLSLHDALPISVSGEAIRCPVPGLQNLRAPLAQCPSPTFNAHEKRSFRLLRSEEHTSELQSRQYLVCRLLLEKKKREIEDVNFTLTRG